MLTCDFHIDLPWQQTKHYAFDLSVGMEHSQISLPKLRAGGLESMFCALYLPDPWQDNYGEARVSQIIDFQIRRLVTQPCATVVDTAMDAEDAYIRKLYPIFLGLEGSRLLGTEKTALERLSALRMHGVKYLTLTHNRNNAWADSATDVPNHKGLTKFGVELVRECENLGIYVDISHASDATAAEVIAVSEKPVLATHSGVKHFVKHPRNLSDTMIKAIAQTDGVIGVPFASRFVGDDIRAISKHVDYIIQMTGSCDHVAIGSDLDGAVMVHGVKDASDWKKAVLDMCSERGLSDSAIRKVAGDNIMRML